ncbi:MAG: hypothetical protein R3B68_10400 [Phycisphaerales bacterium]
MPKDVPAAKALSSFLSTAPWESGLVTHLAKVNQAHVERARADRASNFVTSAILWLILSATVGAVAGAALSTSETFDGTEAIGIGFGIGIPLFVAALGTTWVALNSTRAPSHELVAAARAFAKSMFELLKSRVAERDPSVQWHEDTSRFELGVEPPRFRAHLFGYSAERLVCVDVQGDSVREIPSRAIREVRVEHGLANQIGSGTLAAVSAAAGEWDVAVDAVEASEPQWRVEVYTKLADTPLIFVHFGPLEAAAKQMYATLAIRVSGNARE